MNEHMYYMICILHLSEIRTNQEISVFPSQKPKMQYTDVWFVLEQCIHVFFLYAVLLHWPSIIYHCFKVWGAIMRPQVPLQLGGKSNHHRVTQQDSLGAIVASRNIPKHSEKRSAYKFDVLCYIKFKWMITKIKYTVIRCCILAATLFNNVQ